MDKFIDTWVTIDYRVKFSGDNSLSYVGLIGKYVERVVWTNDLGNLCWRESKIQDFFGNGEFAVSRLYYDGTFLGPKSKFWLEIDFSVLEKNYPKMSKISVLPYGLANVTVDAVDNLRKEGVIAKYFIGSLLAKYDVDVMKAAGLDKDFLRGVDSDADAFDNLCKDIAEKLKAALTSCGFFPKRRDFVSTNCLRVPISGTILYDVLKVIKK